MLGVTFPVIVVFCGALGFWPLEPRPGGDELPVAETPGAASGPAAAAEEAGR
jgi:hypothetical protein